MKTNVFITVDTEFSIGGAFAQPEKFKPVGYPAILCEVGGESQGLGFLLKTFSQFDIKATFFLEGLNCTYFGIEPLKEIATQISNASQDIQLHLHPCWLYFEYENWQQRLTVEQPNDCLDGRSREELCSIISKGLDFFTQVSIAKPNSVRAGKLQVDRTIYSAMAELNIPYSSHLGVGVFRPLASELNIYGGVKVIGGVYELPIFTYQDFACGRYKHLKTMTIIGCGDQELIFLLNQAHQLGIENVVILTHPSEFVHVEDVQYKKIRKNKETQNRLVKLCRYLAENKQRFCSVSFSQLNGLSEQEIPLLKGKLAHTGRRLMARRFH